jgi:hypothetical protein
MKALDTMTPYMIITSDTHVSCPEGRWPQATALFEDFLRSLEGSPPEVFFVNGDIVDNFMHEDGKPVTGTVEHWEKDVATYQSAIAPYEGIAFRGSLGPGHDTGGDITMAHAGERLCSPRGSFAWQGFDFVWISGKVHSFSNVPAEREESFDPDTLRWLDRHLAVKKKVVLLFHVPLRTADTAKHGAWPGNRNITIPPEDGIYDVIDRHLDSIEMIFHGHIHRVIEAEYKGIPIRSSPFYGQGHYSKVFVDSDTLRVELHAFRPPA